jgi:SAM-dependent methyltransferase
MTEIERRIETPRAVVSPEYSQREFTAEQIQQGRYRDFVGGRWDTHGLHQLRFLREHGLRPDHRFLDVGCGALRAGRHLVDLLEPGHYYGVDANLALLRAGYEIELTDEQRERLPVTNLRANDRFDVDFGVEFDMAIAQSVFTHISLNHIRLCLYRVAKVMPPGGRFFATFFEELDDIPVDTVVQRPRSRRPKLTEQNVFWYYRDDLRWASSFGPWRFRYIGKWDHPAGQRMVEFTRVTEAEAAAARRRARRSGRLVRSIRRGRRWAAHRLLPD